MTIEEKIASRILEVQRTKENIIVAFCGAADLGKTYLAKRVVNLVNSHNVRSAHVGLDSFLMERSERKRRGISGYDPIAHDIQQMVRTLGDWTNGKPIKYHPYDHQLGKKRTEYARIDSCEVLLIEGLFSLHETILSFVDLSFFFYAEEEKLKQIKLEADLVKRGYSRQYSEEIYQAEFKLYKQHVEPLREKAGHRLKLHDKWKYILELR